MNILLRFCIFFILFFTLRDKGNAAELSQSGYTLQAAITQTLERDPALRQAHEKIEEQDAQIRFAYAQLFPTISTFGRYNYQKDATAGTFGLFGGTPYNVYAVGLELDQTLYKGGGEWAAIRTVKQEVELKEIEASLLERDLILKVMTTFYDVLLAQARLETLTKTQELQKQLFDYIQKRAKVGVFKRLDVLQVQTELELLTPQVVRAKNELALHGSQLATLLGIKEEGKIRVIGNLDTLSKKAIPERKQETRPELKQVSVTQNQLQNKRSTDLSVHYPALSAFADWGRRTTKRSKLFDENATAWTVGVELRIPLFSGLSSVFQRQTYASKTAQLEFEESRVKDTLYLDQVRATEDVATSRESIEANDRALKVAKEAEKEARSGYRYGTSTYMQFSEAQKNLMTAELSLLQAQRDYVLSLARYYVAQGWQLKDLAGSSSGVLTAER